MVQDNRNNKGQQDVNDQGDEMSLEEAAQRGQDLAQENHDAEQQKLKESSQEAARGTVTPPVEGQVPEHNAETQPPTTVAPEDEDNEARKSRTHKK